MPDTSPGGTPLNVPGPGGFFDEAAHEAATEALYLRLDATKAEGRIVAKTTDEVARGVLNAALDALPERTRAFLVLAGLPEGELVNIMAAAFENRVGTTIGVGDGMRAVLTALGLPVAEAGTTGDEER